MFKRLLLIFIIPLVFVFSAFAEGTWIYGSGPIQVTTGADVVLYKIVFSYIDGIACPANASITAHAAANTWTANANWIAGLRTCVGSWVEYNFAGLYHYIKMKSTWTGNVSDMRHDLIPEFENGIWVDYGANTIGAMFIWDWKALKQDDMNYISP